MTPAAHNAETPGSGELLDLLGRIESHWSYIYGAPDTPKAYQHLSYAVMAMWKDCQTILRRAGRSTGRDKLKRIVK
jgi:hypothetical protein